jgi:hypothetical protein
MADQFQNPTGLKLLKEVGFVFKTKPVFQKRCPLVLFVCGGKLGEPSIRESFIKWSATALPDFKVLLAEQAFKEVVAQDPRKFIDLALFEKLIADISDCILIFPESVGSWAEVGYFSAIEGVRNKILVVNNLKYEATDSFITLGPISVIDEHSFLKPTLHVSFPDPPTSFDRLEERLSRVKCLRRKHLQYQHYRKLDYRQQLCVVSEIIRILRVVTKQGLIRALSNSYGRPRDLELEFLLSILVGANWVSVHDEFFVPTKSFISLLEIEGTEVDKLSARALFYHQKNDPRAFSFASSWS